MKSFDTGSFPRWGKLLAKRDTFKFHNLNNRRTVSHQLATNEWNNEISIHSWGSVYYSIMGHSWTGTPPVAMLSFPPTQQQQQLGSSGSERSPRSVMRPSSPDARNLRESPELYQCENIFHDYTSVTARKHTVIMILYKWKCFREWNRDNDSLVTWLWALNEYHEYTGNHSAPKRLSFPVIPTGATQPYPRHISNI